METKIKNIPEINPEEIINYVMTPDKYGRKQQWARIVTEAQLADLRDAMQNVRGEYVAPSDYAREIGNKRRVALAGLELPGMSKLVDLYNVCCYWDRDDERIKCQVEHILPYLLINGHLYGIPCYNDSKPGETYALYMPKFDPQRVEVSRTGGWKFNEPAPNKIGKATAKKLTAWVEWLDRENASRAAWVRKGEDERAALMKRLESSGAKYSEFADRVIIRNGFLKLEVKFEERGIRPGRPELDFSRCEEGRDILDFMIDREIKITRK